MRLRYATAAGLRSEPAEFVIRDVLGAAGFAVPRTDEALLRIWRREQERAHAA